MKKFLLYCGIAIATLIAFATLFPVAGLLISGVLVAAGLHFYTEAQSVFTKVMSVVLALAGLISALSNVPGFIGIVAIALMYYFYKMSKNKVDNIIVKTDDPFTNFENEWAKLNQ